MKATLLASTQTFAAEALGGFLAERPQVFLVAAATATELLLKARLATVHAALVADPMHFDSLLAACGVTLPAVEPKWRHLRTITVTEAIKRVKRLHPDLVDAKLAELIAARNSVLHAGELPSAIDLGVLLDGFLRACELLAPACESSLALIFGDYNNFVAKRLSEQASAVAREVAGRLAHARSEFVRRHAHLGDVEKAAVFAAIPATYDEGVDFMEYPCPACEQPALLHGELEVEWDEDERHPSGWVVFRPDYFGCSLCGLELRSRQELAAAAIDMSITRDDLDPGDVFGEYEDRY